jgi:hypothetical protein
MNRHQIGVALLLVLAAGGWPAAQPGRSSPDDLRRQVERRFDVFIVKDGVALRPRDARGVRTVEISGGEIAIDGVPATGAELRTKLGADADVVLQLSYLDQAAQRRLFGTSDTLASPAPPTLPETATPPMPPPPPDVRDRMRSRRSGERLRIAGSVRVAEDEVINGDVVAIGGSARVYGEVRGDVVAIGGVVELGPKAIVTKDVTVIGGTLRRDPGARVEGEVHEVGVGSLDLSGLRWTPPSFSSLWWGWTLGAAYALFATFIRIAVLCLLGAVVMLIGRDYVEQVGARAAAEPFKAGAVGFLAQILFVPILIVTIVLLVVTIIGIPLLLLIPFALLGLGAVAIVGFTAVGFHVGRLLSARMGWTTLGPYLTTIVGIVLLVSPLLAARLVGLGGGPLFPMTIALGIIGVVVEYLAWTIGFGAVALARFGKATSSSTV